jgi:NTP pyrophosphatase (non-canonical NTP hydrolase)
MLAAKFNCIYDEIVRFGEDLICSMWVRGFQMPPEIKTLVVRLLQFRDARDWKQFHTLKNLVSALSVETGELLELTQWKSPEDLESAAENSELKLAFSREVADVFIYLLLVCEKLGIDPVVAAQEKLIENEKKYPVDKSRGTARKYNQL